MTRADRVAEELGRLEGVGEDGRGGLKKEAPAVEGDGRLQRRRQKSGREILVCLIL